MKVGIPHRQELGGVSQWIVLTFEKVLARISGVWQIEHLDNGRHGNVHATSVTVGGEVLAGLVTGESVIAELFSTSPQRTTTMATATATTLFDAVGNGLYRVVAFLPDAGAANYAAFADVVSEGTNARIVANNGALLTLTLSGTNVQATQSSGADAAVAWSYLRIR